MTDPILEALDQHYGPQEPRRFRAFPEGFQWGAATAAIQIEGAHNEGNRGWTIWDTFTRQPGKIIDGSTADIACDHYHRFREDVALMASLGVQTYRFSIAWSRIMPFGTGAVNEAGLKFYDELIDELLKHNIQPAITLYHWDLPQALQDVGGWANRKMVDWFAEYAKVCYARYGDRVSRWITLNEPYVFIYFGHRWGWMAPGIRDTGITGRAIHHALLAHGAAVEAFRASGIRGEIGITNANTWYEPADALPGTAVAVERARDFDSRVFHGPVFGKGYPESVLRYFSLRDGALPIEHGDLDRIAAPTDFLGVNLYSRQLVTADPAGDEGQGFRRAPSTLPALDMGYEAAPHALGDFVRWVSNEYGRPKIYITENGVGENTGPGPDGTIDDELRTELVRGFLKGLHGAISDGADVRGYYLWSLMDNFEWAFGYTKRFGMVYTDYETQRRTPKRSARFFSEAARRNGIDA